MSIKDVIPEEKWDTIELKDAGKKSTGGISYAGETLDNFIGEVNLTGDSDWKELIDAMEVCDVAFVSFKPDIPEHGL